MNKDTKIYLAGKELIEEEDYIYFEDTNTIMLHSCFLHWDETRKETKDE